MNRRTALTALVGGLLVGGLALPAVADPVSAGDGDGRTTVCLGTNHEPGATQRGGICVWVPVDLSR